MEILASLEKEKSIVLARLDFLHESIQNLHYEGKMSLQKNVRNIEESIKCLKEILSNHIKRDDEIIFPFAVKHIPILDPMINFLKAERSEFETQLKTFEKLFQKFITDRNTSLNYAPPEKLREKGVYVVCIVRNHMQTEDEGIYKVLDQQLHLPEKRALCALMQKHPPKMGYS